jgi:hypothetical protein
LEGADLSWAHLERASLSVARLEGAWLRQTHLEGADLNRAHLEGAKLTGASFDKTSRLHGAVLTGAALDQVTFDNVNLTVVNWSRVPMLGDEATARKAQAANGTPKNAETRRTEFAAAVRANRVLAVTLRGQGLNEDADKYAYRAQVLQRQLLRRQGKRVRALFSAFLDMLAGHGYRPERTLMAYLLAILGFGTAYYFIGQAVGPHLSPLSAFVFSMTSFHGRGFFPGGIALDDPITVLAALEAFVGLVIEVSFIATFTQRFFAR